MEVIIGGKGAPPPPKKQPNLLVRLLAFLLTLALMLGAVALVAHRDKLNFDALKRWYSYRDLSKSESGQAGTFSFDGSPSDPCASLEGDLLTCSTGAGIRLYSQGGALLFHRAVTLSHPSVESAGRYGLVYDVGGRDLYLYSERTETYTSSLPLGQTLLSARVNQHGWLAVVSQESGHKGAVTVYNGGHEAVMGVRLSNRFVLDAVVSPDSRSAAVLTAGLEDGVFQCWLDLYRLDRTDRTAEDNAPDWSCSLGNNAVLSLRWDGDGIWALGESGLSLVSSDGELAGSYAYDGTHLKAFSLEGEGSAALLLGKYRAGSDARLVLLSPQGEVQAQLELHEQVLSLSSAGRYTAVLTADRLDIYDQNLDLYASLSGTQGARQVMQRSDGSALLLRVGLAQLYVP